MNTTNTNNTYKEAYLWKNGVIDITLHGVDTYKTEVSKFCCLHCDHIPSSDMKSVIDALNDTAEGMFVDCKCGKKYFVHSPLKGSTEDTPTKNVFGF